MPFPFRPTPCRRRRPVSATSRKISPMPTRQATGAKPSRLKRCVVRKRPTCLRSGVFNLINPPWVACLIRPIRWQTTRATMKAQTST
ncbi:UNVERIFIED_CONTAM: hypothetical protein GTU68_024151 [Idotea baltica]|nr:hypothetical protein [Idotea baltica]